MRHRVFYGGHNKLISLGTLQQLRSTHGEGLVMNGRALGISLFPNLEQANFQQTDNKWYPT